MSVTVRVPTTLRTLTGGSAEVAVDGSTVAEVLDGLEGAHPGFKDRLLDDGGQLRRFVNVFVADDDVRFLDASGFDAHEARVCIASGRVLDDPKRPKDYARGQFLKSSEEMAALFADLPEALDNTVEVALRCSWFPKTRQPILPRFAAVATSDEEAAVKAEADELRRQAREGLEERIARHGMTPGYDELQYGERLEYDAWSGRILLEGSQEVLLVQAANEIHARDVQYQPSEGGRLGQIIAKGPEWFAGIGPQRSPGTAIFALTGKVKNTGLVEVPMGITMGEIIFDIGGGVPRDKQFKAVQTGGPLGGCLPASGLNLNVDFDSLRQAGAVMGSGGMIVVDEDTCMVEFSKFFLTFATAESCGKCVPCRVGGRRMLEILNRITRGEGVLEDIDRIEEIAKGMAEGALCALGQLTPGPVLSTLRYFREEFLAHIVDKRCPAGACKDLVRSPCVNACPAGVDVPSYVYLVEQGDHAQALEVHRQRNPFPSICGRVCPAFCESRCRRGDLDQAVAIRQIKRFMADQEADHPWTPATAPANGKKVAVIGSGPAGLTASLRLAELGYRVTVHEALPVAGGMMAVGIPEYRLPRETLNAEIEAIRRAGVEIVLNSRLGRDVTIDSLMDADGCHAVLLALGAQNSRAMRVPGEDLEGVWGGTEFLQRVALHDAPDMAGKRVAVVGGGNTAIDAARTAMRLGASEVHLVYRRTRQEMPAQELEIHEAEEEGLQIHALVNPTRIVGNGRVEGLELIRQELGDFDESARRRPNPIEGSEFVLPVDVVIEAIGQSTDTECVGDCGVTFNRNTTVQVEKNLATTRPGVFAAGDAVLGPATVVEAVAQGNKAAEAIHAYLAGAQAAVPAEWHAYDTVPLSWPMEEYAEAVRAEMPVQAPDVRRNNWKEVELGFAEAQCREECRRCLRCDLE